MSTDKQESTENTMMVTQTVKSNNTNIHTINNPSCPYCKSDNVYGISRVVGYFSIIDNWNKSKKSELKRRQKGNYWDD